jgi:hypothetical protein
MYWSDPALVHESFNPHTATFQGYALRTRLCPKELSSRIKFFVHKKLYPRKVFSRLEPTLAFSLRIYSKALRQDGIGIEAFVY